MKQLILVYVVRNYIEICIHKKLVRTISRSTETVHTSAKARLTSAAVWRISIEQQIYVR